VVCKASGDIITGKKHYLVSKMADIKLTKKYKHIGPTHTHACTHAYGHTQAYTHMHNRWRLIIIIVIIIIKIAQIRSSTSVTNSVINLHLAHYQVRITILLQR